jgi:hypothetical protein
MGTPVGMHRANPGTSLVVPATSESFLDWLRLRNPAMMAWLVHVLIIHTTAALTVALSPGRDSMRPDLGGPARYLVAPLALWDGGWYRRIVLDGYGDTQETAAFWPAYPALVRALSSATGLSPESSGVLISNLAFLGGLIALQRLVTRSYGVSVAMRAVWLVALNPVAFFFSAFYTESLFLLLSIGAIRYSVCTAGPMDPGGASGVARHVDSQRRSARDPADGCGVDRTGPSRRTKSGTTGTSTCRRGGRTNRIRHLPASALGRSRADDSCAGALGPTVLAALGVDPARIPAN